MYSQYALSDVKTFGGQEWGYLVLLYLYLIAVRYLLVFAFYPVTKSIGLGTNVKESVFMSYAGFRGAVGIALSLSLWANVISGVFHLL
jgi:NhaP-type Na+/H+ or K+/H+ antiporter